jgi:hypothetical protein
MCYESLDIFRYVEDVLTIQKTRKRIYIDKRNYLIYILYHKFFYTEEVLAEHFQVDHTTINYVKRTFSDLLKYPTKEFKFNIKELVKLFPLDFKPRAMNRIKLKSVINLKDVVVLEKLREYCEKTNKRPTDLIDGLLNEILTIKLYELNNKKDGESKGTIL